MPGREEIDALGAAWRSCRDAEAGIETVDYAALEEAARAAWGRGDHRDAGRRLEPAAHALVALAGVAPGQRILDVGAGDGGVAVAAAAAGARVTALDLAPEAVSAGRDRCAAGGVDVEWTAGSVESIPFPDASFDAVLSGFGAMFAPRPRLAAAEMARVTRAGGPIAMTAWQPSGFMGGVLDIAAERARLPPNVPRPARWGRYESAFLWLGDLVEGFDVAEASLTFAFADTDAAWASLVCEPGPFAAALRGLPEPARGAARAQFDELLARFAAPAEPPAVAVSAGYGLISGRKPAHS